MRLTFRCKKWTAGVSAGTALSRHGGAGPTTGPGGGVGPRSSRTLPAAWPLRTSPWPPAPGEHLRARSTPLSPPTTSTRRPSCPARPRSRKCGIWATSNVSKMVASVVEAAGKLQRNGKWQRFPSVGSRHSRHATLRLKAQQFGVWWTRISGRGPVSPHLQLPAHQGPEGAHAPLRELSIKSSAPARVGYRSTPA